MYRKGFKVVFEGTEGRLARAFQAIDFRMEFEQGKDGGLDQGHIYVCLTDDRELHFCTQGDGNMIKDIMKKIMSDYKEESECKGLSKEERYEYQALSRFQTKYMPDDEVARLNELKKKIDDSHHLEIPFRIPNCYGIIGIRSAEEVRHEKATFKMEDYGERGF